MISVVIPIHNLGSMGDYSLNKCLDSIINQTYTDFEVLLMENGSTDDTVDIAKEYCNKNNRFQLYILDEVGVSNARNKGIEFAKGEYITFIDGDDFISSDFLQAIYDFIKNNNIDFGILSSSFYYTNSKKIKPLFQCMNSIIHYKTDTYNINTLKYVWGKIFKTNFIRNKFYFNTNLSYGEDTLFSLDVFLSATKYAFIAVGVYYYTQNRHGQETNTLSFNKAFTIIEFNRLKQEILLKHGIINKIENTEQAIIPFFVGKQFATTVLSKGSFKKIHRIIAHYYNIILSLDIRQYNGPAWQLNWFKRFQKAVKIGGGLAATYLLNLCDFTVIYS